MPALRLEIMSRWGVMTLRMVMIWRFMSNSVPSCSSVGVLRMAALELVDGVVEVRQHREERVDQRVHDQVEDHHLGGGRVAGVVGADAVADLPSAGQSPWCRLMMQWSVRKQCTSATFLPSPAIPKVTMCTKSS